MSSRAFPVRPTLAAAVLLVALTGCSALASASTHDLVPAPGATGVSVSDGDTLALLATIPVKGKAPKTGYDRVGDFGEAWLDVDHNHCDTRDDILARDLTGIATSGACRVESGTLADPYTGAVIHFVRGEATSAAIQIDHLVALSDAWQTGAQQLGQGEREALANDPLNLLAVDGPTNESKGDGDAATWLPAQKSFRCSYVGRQVQVKAKYGLWVTSAEHDAIARILSACVGATVSTPTPTPPAPTTSPVPAPGESRPITPGAICDSPGAAGVAATGRGYTCGGRGPDSAGHLHWNS